MNTYDVSFQFVDSPRDQSKPGSTIPADRLIDAFRDFPFADEIKRADTVAGGPTLPTISFKRKSDGEEIAVWTEDALRFDLCLVGGGEKAFVNNRSKEEVEMMLSRFATESIAQIRPPKRGFFQRLFG
jgi:hypothetical protein